MSGIDPQTRTAVGLCTAIRQRSDGPVVWRERVSEADLGEARSEFWMREFLRRGEPEVPLNGICCEVEAIDDREQPGRIAGYRLIGRGCDSAGERFTVFSAASLRHVAARGAERLVNKGVLQPGDAFYYEIEEHGGSEETRTDEGHEARALRLVERPVPLKYLRLPLSALKEKSLAVGETRDWEYPVFYTRDAYAHAERCARKGAGRSPPVESGAVLAGPLCSCPETGEFFAVVCLALEMVDAEEGEASLRLSAGSWSRIQAAMSRVQSNPATAAFRILGQAHGHPFSVVSSADESQRHRTSVFVSEDDLAWSRAVFTRQPWQLCHIFGQDDQRRPVDGLFGQRDCTLMRRGFYLLRESDGFDVLSQGKLSLEVDSHG